MKWSDVLFAACFAALASADVPGFDVAKTSLKLPLAEAYAAGDRFIFIQSTEGTQVNPGFGLLRDKAADAGFVHGAIHVGRPQKTLGKKQANFFISNGGGWTPETGTLPGTLWLSQFDPSGRTMEVGHPTQCFGLTSDYILGWMEDFVTQYHASQGRWPIIYTTLDWWFSCTGNSLQFSNRSPLWFGDGDMAAGGILPGGWPETTFRRLGREHARGGLPDLFDGTVAQLRELADEA